MTSAALLDKHTRSSSEFGLKMGLKEQYVRIREQTEKLCLPLLIEDYGVQSMPEVSPPKWHLAHTTWFFETFVLMPYVKGYRPFHPAFGYLFNSYYEALGERVERSKRGLLSRPAVHEVHAYRQHVDQAMTEFVSQDFSEEVRAAVILGLNHEQQHQELLIADIKHIFWSNPLRPIYQQHHLHEAPSTSRLEMIGVPGGLIEIGAREGGFAYDLETPRHPVFLQSYRLASRTVTNGEYLEFMQAGGYDDPTLWLSDGWEIVRSENWSAPLYWEKSSQGWKMMTLSGLREISLNEPVCHVSYYEADAYARFREMRLPTEQEWENVARRHGRSGHYQELGIFQPLSSRARGVHGQNSQEEPFEQLMGGVWEWTQSAFLPYPGFKPLKGALGEYNGKFMSGQMVLRGGSCATPESHMRTTYRNFFSPATRWQFSGIRLAADELRSHQGE